MSQRSEINRMDAATGLAMLAREMAEEIAVFSFADQTVRVPARRGFALRDAIVGSQLRGGTMLGQAVRQALQQEVGGDRLIVITDEQAHDAADWSAVPMRTWLVNVASYQPAVAAPSARLHRVDGFSEAVLDYIATMEAEVLPAGA